MHLIGSEMQLTTHRVLPPPVVYQHETLTHITKINQSKIAVILLIPFCHKDEDKSNNSNNKRCQHEGTMDLGRSEEMGSTHMNDYNL